MMVFLRFFKEILSLSLVLFSVQAKTESFELQRLTHPKQQMLISYAPVVKKVAPAVVNIYAVRLLELPALAPPFAQDPFFKQFMGELLGSDGLHKRVQSSLGSGVIIRQDGLIITNYHVVRNAEEIRIVLSDHREFIAKVEGVDEPADLAILKISDPQEGFPFLELGDADDLEVGDLILAVGNPFGVGQTITHGIVSAGIRTQISKNDFRAYIQTDAAINPGNSGGALVNLEGRLVGINTAIYSKSGGSVGIGFATPSNLIIPLLEHFKKGKSGVRSWSGVDVISLTPELAGTLRLKSLHGAVIKDVTPHGPGDQAGLQVGDVILRINGHEIQDAGAFRFRIATIPLDKTVQILIVRQGREKTFPLKVKEPPPQEPLHSLETEKMP